MEIEQEQTPGITPDVVETLPEADLITGELVGDVAMEEETSNVRENAIYLSGVDEFGAKDVEKFVLSFYDKPFFMEWIDDTSLNLVYDDAEDAFQCLVAMTAEEEFSKSERIEPTQLRRTKSDPERGISLNARFATPEDKKAERSREKSRYYLLNGEPTRKDDIVRFGSERSGAYKYGTRDQDLLGRRSRRRNRPGSELFPSKAKMIRATDDQMLQDRAREPDLFAHKLGISKSRNRRKRTDRQKKTSASPAPTVYSNMDY